MEDQERLKALYEKRAKRFAKRDIEDIRFIMSDPRGRRVFHALITEAGVFHHGYTGDNGTFFNCGKRDLGLRMLNMVTVAMPDAFTMMQQEHKKEMEELENELKQETKE